MVRLLLLVLFVLQIETPAADIKPLIRQLMETREALEGIPFAQVVAANTGKRLIPIDKGSSTDRRLISKISAAMERVLKTLSKPDHPAHQQKRINEVSRFFEEAMLTELAAVDGFECGFPKTAAGRSQRSGYPDLRLVDTQSGHVVYLDPKLYQSKSRNSSLRTFYFTPKLETNKILEDANHLLVGIAHEGKNEGVWKFASWEMVDLSGFKVRLKAEFQAGNRDIYRDENIIARGD
ncbi:MAG: hypothetical protein ACJASX_003037 [Limisphaerales bacterium]|jgi:hypothetical protein